MASIFVTAIVILLDIIALGLAAAAEQRRSRAQVVSDADGYYTYCVYDSDIATGYGVVALLFLLGSQALIMVASSCFCCGRSLRPGGSRACAMLLFIACWVTFIIAETCLLAGSVRNAYHTKYRAKFNIDSLSCETIRKGVFAAGAAFTFFTCILSILYYHFFSKAKGSPGPYGKDSGQIGMNSYT